MKNEFIPYKEALALKELGFDETCFAFFRTPYKTPLLVNAFQMVDYEKGQIINKIEDGSLVPCPTYHQAFKWFENDYKHRHYISMNLYVDSDDYIYWEYTIYDIDVNEVCSVKNNVKEEAELACLIKLIELVKDKS